MYNNIMVILFTKKIIFLFRFVQLMWSIKCLILTSTKHLPNKLRDGTLSVISTVKKNSILSSLDFVENTKRHFFFGHSIHNINGETYENISKNWECDRSFQCLSDVSACLCRFEK